MSGVLNNLKVISKLVVYEVEVLIVQKLLVN